MNSTLMELRQECDGLFERTIKELFFCSLSFVGSISSMQNSYIMDVLKELVKHTLRASKLKSSPF